MHGKVAGRVDLAKDVLAEDLAHVMHPFASPADLQSLGVLVFVEGQGLRLKDHLGNVYLDAYSGLLNVNIGYGRGELAEAAARELAKAGYLSLFEFRSNEPAVRLASKLAEIAPPGIDRFFFTGSGSESCETAIKLARYHFAVQGYPEKFKVISRWQNYHGVTFGSLAATGVKENWENFGPLPPGFSHIDQPTALEDDAPDALEEQILREGPETVAAFIAEPISMVAKVLIPSKGYWPRIREICSRYGVLMIVDEVVTGFGRTGKMFGIEHWGVTPDLLALSKGISSGYLPLGAVGISEAVYQKIAIPGKIFRHGCTTDGHPACCAVGLRNIEIIEQEQLVNNAAAMGDYLKQRLLEFREKDRHVGDVRGLGMLVAVDLVADREKMKKYPSDARVGARIKEYLRQHKMLLRNYGDTIALGPALVATPTDVAEIAERLGKAIVEITTQTGEYD